MELKSEYIKIGEIALDKNNPRLWESFDDQNSLKEALLKQEETKDLLKSMKHKVQWVNKIVIRRVNETIYTTDKQYYIDNNFEYVVVEGNSRLSCLKSGQIEGYDSNTEIPVLIAEKELKETEEDYRESIRIIQGIANVMVVKDWSPASKARHIYQMVKYRMSLDKTRIDAAKEVSEELGIDKDEINRLIYMYHYYHVLNEDLEVSIDPEFQWSHLEGLNVNSDTREFVGYDKNSLKFDWEEKEESEYDEEDQLKISRLKKFKKYADPHLVSATQFRKKFKLLVNHENADELIDEIINQEKSWADIEQSQEDKEKEWSNRLDNIGKNIKQFPNQSEWSFEQLSKLIKIEDEVQRQVKILNQTQKSVSYWKDQLIKINNKIKEIPKSEDWSKDLIEVLKTIQEQVGKEIKMIEIQ